jgi:hypothetical protein
MEGDIATFSGVLYSTVDKGVFWPLPSSIKNAEKFGRRTAK